MEVDQTVQERVFAAADELLAEGGNDFPTLEAVRRRARVNMTDVSPIMKEWRRRKRTSASDPVALHLPADLEVTCTTALAQLWQQAVTLANEPLR